MFHPRSLVHPVEWHVIVPGRPDPVAVIRRLRVSGRLLFRVVTWAASSEGRELLGYADTLDIAAERAWRAYVERNSAAHEVASRTHGDAERGGPATR